MFSNSTSLRCLTSYFIIAATQNQKLQTSGRHQKSRGLKPCPGLSAHFQAAVQTQPCSGVTSTFTGQEDLGKSMDQIRLAQAGAATQKFISRRPLLIFPHTIGKNSFESLFSENLPQNHFSLNLQHLHIGGLVIEGDILAVISVCSVHRHQLLIFHSLGHY